MRKRYASAISPEKLEEIRPLLQSVHRRTKPTTVDMYEVFCAAHSYFAKWSEPDQNGIGVLERALKNRVGAARSKLERSACTTFSIVDAQSVRNTDTAALKGYDAGKKVSASSATYRGI